MTTFFLVRHAWCEGLGDRLWKRTVGIFLNEAGRAREQCLAERFSAIKLDAIYSSALERARETAEAIARLGKLEVKPNRAFNEIDFSDWTLRSFESLSRHELWHRFNRECGTTRISGGDRFLDVQARVIVELEKLSQQHGAARVVIVSHADVIKAVVGYVAGTPIDLLRGIEISPCSVTILATHEHDTRLLAVNSRSELV